MEIIIKGVLVHSINDIEIFSIKVDDKKSLIIKKKLEEQNNKAINILKRLKDRGEIKSIWIPKNKKIQNELNNLVKAKKEIKNSLKNIKELK